MDPSWQNQDGSFAAPSRIFDFQPTEFRCGILGSANQFAEWKPMSQNTELFGIYESLSGCWKKLIVADLLYKLLALVVLTPIFSLLLSSLLSLSGNSVLSDIDIAYFLAGPFGWFCAILLGAVWLGIIALEQSSLLAILAASAKGKRLGIFHSLKFAARHAPAILRVTGRLIAYSLLILAPFLGIALATYFWLLGEYDINYYLKERPKEFQIAVGVGIALAILLIYLLLRMVSNWFLALPLVLFDNVPAKTALSESQRHMTGHRIRVCLWILGWLLAGFLLNAVSTIIVGAVGRILIPKSAHSLVLLAGQVGLMLIILTVSSLVLNLISTIAFSLILFHGYRTWNPRASEAIEHTSLSGAKGASNLPALTRPRLAAAGVIGILLSALVGVIAINSLRLEDNTQVMGHRGAASLAPENTLAAMQAAIDAKADWVEIDVQETVDGEVIVIHDSDFMKLAKDKRKIWALKIDEVNAIDIGSWFDKKFADQRAPTLAQVLDLCKGKVGVIIELKYYGHDQKLEERVGEIVDRCGMSSQVMAMSLKPAGVKKMKALRPKWKCGVLMSVAVGNIQRLDADFLAVNGKFATRSLVNKAHQAGKEIYVWTINDPATMSMMMNRGVDGILTDRPDLARQVLAQRAEMNSSQRVLTEIAALLGAKPEIHDQ